MVKCCRFWIESRHDLAPVTYLFKKKKEKKLCIIPTIGFGYLVYETEFQAFSSNGTLKMKPNLISRGNKQKQHSEFTINLNSVLKPVLQYNKSVQILKDNTIILFTEI